MISQWCNICQQSHVLSTAGCVQTKHSEFADLNTLIHKNISREPYNSQMDNLVTGLFTKLVEAEAKIAKLKAKLKNVEKQLEIERHDGEVIIVSLTARAEKAERATMTVKKDKRTPENRENREFWEVVAKAAETVETWPAWKRGESVIDPRITEQIDRLQALPDGWMNGEGRALDTDGLIWLAVLLDKIQDAGVPLPHLYPTIEGGVEAEWSIHGREVGVTLNLKSRSVSALAVSTLAGEKDVFLKVVKFYRALSM